MTIFKNDDELATWVLDHAGEHLSDEEADLITKAILRDPEFPGLGVDCQAYLASLPNLAELIDEMGNQRDD